MTENELTLFLCGDVMLGRGIDQILARPSDPQLHESYVRSALGYVELAEATCGRLPRRVAPAYVWGDMPAEFAAARPDLRVINLETAVTASDDAWPGKGIHYRMHPANIDVLTAANVDCCVLANNHVLDWGRAGLVETLEVQRKTGIRCAGAGRDAAEAWEPAVLPVGTGATATRRVLVFAFATLDCGTAPDWAASPTRPGIALVSELNDAAVTAIAARVRAAKHAGDIAIASIHWGGNWGYAIAGTQREFAHALIDSAQVDLVHGHSSHHVKGIEVYRRRLILYGCGDFINDYEGIGGHEAYRADLGLAYFATLDARSGELMRLAMTPTRVRRFRIERAPGTEARWLAATLTREGRLLGTRTEHLNDDRLSLAW